VALLFDEYLDEEGDLYGRAPGDQNTYTTGRIGNYNVVLVLLPGMGKVHAASAAANFRSSYGNVHLALLVGICGGVPKDNEGREILLGDVVVSTQIIEYDLIRRFPDKPRRKAELSESH
jgi:nucleoside phosphorylase